MTIHQTASASRNAGITYHLVPAEIWEAQQQEWYTPEAFEADGFIHCTNGTDELLKVANLFYTGDPRQFAVLVLDIARIASDVRYDDRAETYPHVYGQLNTSAVVGTLSVTRDDNGQFVSIVADS